LLGSIAHADIDADASSAFTSSGLHSAGGDADPVGRDLPLPSLALDPASPPPPPSSPRSSVSCHITLDPNARGSTTDSSLSEGNREHCWRRTSFAERDSALSCCISMLFADAQQQHAADSLNVVDCRGVGDGSVRRVFSFQTNNVIFFLKSNKLISLFF
jgi:hypothetical protein